ncbi:MULTISPECIES: glycosyltransferase family 4 protein [Klebsiella pneumoniae complex]|uniref:Glycosyltransferase family 1 protein n=2 Tax=Klebsiella pneumoniae complex TaxID=3390273 RepID=A0AAW9PE28_KLEVA|nr:MULTISPECIES: glycosyltransferase family 1 protein [Klebsiella]EIW8532290.1 glycosyltransferase family 1 protein [Klebsiella pneumoniae]EIW8766410.1 glycosyltransferase family 1 protein [Klebsiella pneumoniae]MBC4903215.1 glycosyltransferase family 4 protein [Klebsiella pneumoniae]MBC4969950.1 glycosyltransferase family 4 protein [Klebsiella pneumoniae]MBG1741736.1 glycosyltransferase family 4 protein [Klebsiella pneumoniae]
MIYINARFLTQELTGVQRFAKEISFKLNEIRNDLIFLVPDDGLLTSSNSKLNIKVIKGGNGHFWEQFTLPAYLRKVNNPLLLNLCNTGPAFYKNQIITHHDITYVKYPQSFPFKFTAFYKMLTPLILSNCKRILTVSEFSRQEIAEHYSCDLDKIDVVYNAVNASFKISSDKSIGQKKYLLAVSSPALHKNFHGLIHSFVKSNLDIDLIIIGAASKSISKIDFNSDERIRFMGRVSDEKLINLYQNATAFIFPSFYEGFGIPPLEAQACGCPVLSSDRASMKEILKDSVLYFDPQSADDISNSIFQIIDSSELRRDLIRKGSVNVARFSWEQSADQVNNIINACR